MLFSVLLFLNALKIVPNILALKMFAVLFCLQMTSKHKSYIQLILNVINNN